MLFECLPHARLALSLSSCLPASSWNEIRGSGPARRDYAARRLPSSTRCRGEPRLDRLGTHGPIRLGRTMRRLCHFPLPPNCPPLDEPRAVQSRAATSPADQCTDSVPPMLGRETSLAHEVLCSVASRTSFSCFWCSFVEHCRRISFYRIFSVIRDGKFFQNTLRKYFHSYFREN